MKFSSFVFLALISLQASAMNSQGQLAKAFPTQPDTRLTQGSLCDTPTERRYKEGIAYCHRSVSSEAKWQIIHKYDQELGYHIAQTGRENFKIDHYIPLCAGGSNKQNNLWPQHRSVYEITDPLEQEVCIKMAAGKLRQADALEIIRIGKNKLESVSDLLQAVKDL